MANPFDQFDAPATAAPATANPFDQFDAPAAKPPGEITATRTVTQAATGFNKGLSSTVLRALDTPFYFGSKALGGEGVHPLEGTFNEYFVEPMGEPQNGLESIVRKGGEVTGENLPLLAAGGGAAKAGISSGVTAAEQLAPGVTNKIRGAADSVLDWMRANPGAALRSDAGGAFASGAGGETAKLVAQQNDASPEMQQGAEIAGQLLTPAGIAAYSKVSPASIAVKGGSKIVGKAIEALPESALPEAMRPQGSFADRQADKLAFSNREGKYENPDVPAPPEPNFVTRRMDAGAQKRADSAAETVSKDFNEVTSRPEAASNLAEAETLKKEIPGFAPGVAKETGDPALLNLQRKIEGEATGTELRDAQERTDASRGAIRDHMDSIVPPTDKSFPQDTVAATNATRVKGVNDKIEGQKDAVSGKIQETSDSLPVTDASEVGDYLRGTRKALKGEADAKMTELRRGVDPDGTGVVTVEGQKPMSVNEALDRRAQINQDLADHYGATNRDAAATKTIRQLQAEKETLDNAIGEVNAPGLKEYNDYYRNEYAPRFLQGASRDVGRFNRNGYEGNRVASEDVPGEFFKPNNVSEARQFNKLYGEDPAVRQKMTDYALDDLRRATIDPNTGQIKEGSVNKWMAKNQRVLDEMPWVRDAVSVKNPDELYARLGQLEGRQRTVGETKVWGLLGKNPEQHIDAALNDWQVMRGLRNSVRGDAQAEAALTRSVWDRATAATGKDTLINADGLQSWIDGHRRSLAQVLTPQHLNSLETIIKAARVEGQLPRAKGAVAEPASMGDKAFNVVGLSLPSVLSRWINVNAGRASVKTVGAEVATRVYRQLTNNEIEKAWKEALYNPKVASQLAVIAKDKSATPIQLTRLHNYLVTVGIHDAKEDSDKKPLAANVEN